jgi:hypothetical protein
MANEQLPITDNTVPAGRNPSDLRTRPNPPPDRPEPKDRLQQAYKARTLSFARHVSGPVGKEKNGLHGQLEAGAKNRLNLN